MNRNNNMRRNGRQPRRTARRPTAVATGNNVITTRIFRGTERVQIGIPNTDLGGVQAFFSTATGIGAYDGSNYISNNHEQYRVVNIKIQAKPSIGLVNAPSDTEDAVRFQNLAYAICNQTEVQSFVDYDTAGAPTTYDQVLRRPNLRVRGLSPTAWTMIGNFAPKAISNPSGGVGASRVFDSGEWMTTQNLDTTLHGLRGIITCRAPLFTISGETSYPAVDLLFTATVQMRGNKNEETSVLFSQQRLLNDAINEKEEELASKPVLPPIQNRKLSLLRE